ncbi:MAG: hypothetical protein ACTHKG_04940 [Nocardioides sp.]
MDTTYAVLLLVTAVGTTAYWVDFFVRGSVNVVEEDWYVKFERSFPAADGFMSLCAAVAAVGLLADEGWGVAFALVTAGTLVFLALMDITFNLENRLYRFLDASWPMRAELVINVWTLGLGAALLVSMVGRVD